MVRMQQPIARIFCLPCRPCQARLRCCGGMRERSVKSIRGDRAPLFASRARQSRRATNLLLLWERRTSRTARSPHGRSVQLLLSFTIGRNRVIPGASRCRTTAAIHGIINAWLETKFSSLPCVAPGSIANVNGAPADRPLFHNVSASSVPAVSSFPPAISSAGIFLNTFRSTCTRAGACDTE